MFPIINHTDAAAQDWDMVIAGSSFAAMFFLRGLPEGLRVLVVEKGPLLLDAPIRASRDRGLEEFAQDNRSDHRKLWVAHSVFGGNSNCWWGQTPRFHPSDFELFERYGQAAPWPLDYGTLEPYYSEVEALMGIAGGDSDHLLPRSSPFPFPAHQVSRSDAACIAAQPEYWVPCPTARSNGADRGQCCANAICDRCPVDAKYTILNGFSAFDRPDVWLLPETELWDVQFAGRQTRAVTIRDTSGALVEIPTRAVGLGANGIFNAAILLRSGLEHAALGRFLHEQGSDTHEIDIAHEGYFGGTTITAHCYGAYDGPHRREAGAVLMETLNAPASIRLEPGRWTDRMHIKFIAEDIPQAENRIELARDGSAQVIWHGHHDYVAAGLAHAAEILPRLLPFEIEGWARGPRSLTEAHIQGTHRMGTDPNSAVTDAQSRVHGYDGLYALGAGNFPTSSPANPTLTLAALSLMAGRSLAS